jgi:hypothetical protein
VAQEIREFAVLIPAGTPKSAPLTVSIAFPERKVTAITWRVPPGPSGLMGWALTSAGTPVIPIQQHTYIVTDNQTDTWYLDGYLDSGNWQVTAYNTGLYDHTVYLTFLLDLPGAADISPAPPQTGGLGVVGATGTVVTPPPGGGGGGSSMPPPDDSPSVVAAVLTALLAQVPAGGGG